jgi:hypothetical protein
MEDWFNNRLPVYHDFGHALHIPAGWFTGKFNNGFVFCHLVLDLQNMILDSKSGNFGF